MPISIEILSKDNKSALERLIADLHIQKDAAYVDRCVDKSVDNFGGCERITLCAYVDNIIAGFCILNFNPAFVTFQKLDIPELQDLHTHPDFRRQGVAMALIEKCEALAVDRGATALGLGVGLHAGYGNAQRLYIKMGFSPDGQGVVYDAQGVVPNDIRPIDDDLCLMMIKNL